MNVEKIMFLTDLFLIQSFRNRRETCTNTVKQSFISRVFVSVSHMQPVDMSSGCNYGSLSLTIIH